jgi:RNA polymerase sigma factor (sigma-70 family)
MHNKPDPRSDAQLVRAAADDPDAFRCLYDRYAARVHRFFVRRSSDPQAAVDLTAETFAQAWLSKGRFRDLAGGTAGPWIFTIARRVLLASVARQRLETTALQRLRVEWSARTSESAIPDESWLDGMDVDLRAALDELPVRQRRALELRIMGDLPYDAVACELGCSATAARIQVSRSLAWLRTQLEGSQG